MSTALAISCQVYPREYAYHKFSVTRTETSSANCAIYPADLLNQHVFTENYIHCSGTQLRLADSYLGSDQYNSSDYYVWNAGASIRQLLFIFPTRVNLTSITLHYYSDSVKGLRRLRFFAVPDDFEVWDAPTASYNYTSVAAVPPGGEPAGRRSVNIGTQFNVTRKVLLSVLNNDFVFAVSEIEFSTKSCQGKFNTDAWYNNILIIMLIHNL